MTHAGPIIDIACFRSKNLYNTANYIVRQEYIFHNRYISYNRLDKLLKHHPNYCALPRKVSQWVLKQLDHDWHTFFATYSEWQVHPEKFHSRPRLPKYKHPTHGRNLLTYTSQAISKRIFKLHGMIQPSQLKITIQTQQTKFDQVRIVPRKTHYVIEIVYTAVVKPAIVDTKRVAAIDIGIDNLATVTSNQPDFIPLLVNGRPLKSINQGYNKQRARLQSLLKGTHTTSRQLDTLNDRRNCRVNSYLHMASRRIVDVLVAHRIGKLVIGKNNDWKHEVNLGKRTNQNFVQIPHSRFIHMLTYKAELVGIEVILTEESYTSKCSFLDREPIRKHEVYLGKRVKRWLFVASDGREIHADVNGSLNIMRKVIPNAFEAWGIEAAVVQPVRVTPHEWLP